jgi:PAS domain S-box-containing protein
MKNEFNSNPFQPGFSDFDGFGAIYTASPMGIVFVDPEGRIFRSNPAFQKIVDRNEENIVGKTLFELTHVEDQAKCLEVIQSLAGIMH